MKIRIDTYYDITCDGCAQSWSTDFDGEKMSTSRFISAGMGMATNKMALSKRAYRAGWKCRAGKTLCPECVRKHKNKQPLPADT